ncbi:MAG: transglycosylase domain-containing protein [Elstera sp.]
MTRAKPSTAAAKPPYRPPPPRRSWGRRVLVWLGALMVWGIVAVGGVGAFYALQLPPIGALMDETRRPGITLLARDGSLLATGGEFYATPRAVRELPPHVWQAVVAIEDRRFFDHFGIDPIGLGRAIIVNLTEGRSAQGGSTLTQQVAKNVFLTNEKSLKRKVQEALLALWLERRYSKEQILGIYLNRVYLGGGAWGIDAASQRYFGKPATQLSLYEAAAIAGLLRAPTRLTPIRDPNATAGRAQVVLEAMVRAQFISDAAAQTAIASGAPMLGQIAAPRPGRHFADWVMEELGDIVPIDRDLVVQTTLDPALQRQTEEKLAMMLAQEGGERKIGEGAAVILDPDGAIRAMVGGRDYRRSQFNRALAPRQPGSSFKPFVFLAALEAGWTAESAVDDSPLRIGSWSPENYDRRFRGAVSLSQALADSLNTPTVRLAQDVGIKRVISLAHRLGIRAKLPANLAVALGAGEVTLLDLTGAYATLANGGKAAWPYGILTIRDRAGKLLWQGEPLGDGLVAPALAESMREMLRGVVTHGTGKAAGVVGPGAVGKTGTTSDYRDAWFVGWDSTQGRVAGVWLGNDDNSPMARVTGGDVPAKLWAWLMLD